MDIILGVFKPGERLVETQLATDMGVSRGPIRTTLQLLEQEGLVVSMSNGGTKVVGFTRKNAEDMFDFRLLMERKALELAIENPLTNFHPLLNVIDSMQMIHKKGPLDHLTDTITSIDIQFHRSILVMAENQSMLQAWNTMANVLYTVLSITNTTYTQFYDYFVDHKEISDMIIQRSPQTLDKIDYHIHKAKEILVARLDDLMQNRI
jgi:DNA-binding GntR family transcriptional regulator